MTEHPEFPDGEFPDQGHEPTQAELAEWAADAWAHENDRDGDPDEFTEQNYLANVPGLLYHPAQAAAVERRMAYQRAA